jgi:hypothetical protein
MMRDAVFPGDHLPGQAFSRPGEILLIYETDRVGGKGFFGTVDRCHHEKILDSRLKPYDPPRRDDSVVYGYVVEDKRGFLQQPIRCCLLG